MKSKPIAFGVVYALLALLLTLSMILAFRAGAVHMGFRQILGYFADGITGQGQVGSSAIDENVFLQIRLPRVLLCAVVGAALAVSGTLMQALFRNPIVEPGLAGTSAGAAFGAAVVFVFGGQFNYLTHTVVSALVLPVSAFAGGLCATLLVYNLSTVRGKITVSTLILVGVAVNALATGGTGFLSYIAHDPQARSITFWSLGTFTGADWTSFFVVATSTVIGIGWAMYYAKGLNTLLLGESEAQALGTNTEKLKRRVIIANTLMVAIATSMVGVISFMGLVVPHILRMIKGADNRYLIIGSSLLGASMMILADTAARTLIAPAELPIGVLTAVVGAPVFISMLIHQARKSGGGGFYA